MDNKDPNKSKDPVGALLVTLADEGKISPEAAGMEGESVMPAMPQEPQPESGAMLEGTMAKQKEALEPTEVEDFDIEEPNSGEDDPTEIITVATYPEVDDALIDSVSYVESRNIWDARSESDAVGIMQVKPKFAVKPGYEAKSIFDVADEMGVDTSGISRDTEGARELLLKPEVNREYGAQYLRAMKDRFGSVQKALIAYNWGPGDTSKWVKAGADLEELPTKVTRYLDKIERTLNGEDVYAAPLY